MITNPWHSVKPYAPHVYHNSTLCKTGNNIERENVRSGDGGRPLCTECKNEEAKAALRR